jgi:hypothetical protein
VDISTFLALARAVVTALEQLQAQSQSENGNADPAAASPVPVPAAPAGAPVGAVAPAGEAPRRGPGRPKKDASAKSAAPDLASVTAACSEKLKELAGKLDGDEAGAREIVKQAVKQASGVERLKEVPLEKLAAVRDAVQALDVPEAGDGNGDTEEF